MILSEIEQSIKRKIESIGTPIRDWPVCIRYGIKTGLNDAFIIDASKREEILRNCTTESERVKANEIIRPILRGKDIKAYSYKFNNQYIIATYNGYISEKGMHFPSIDIEEYPAVKSHLDYYWNRISKRSDQGDTPYNLRSCSYWDDFNKPKLAWNRIAQHKIFGIVPSGIYIHDSMHFIVGENIEYLSATLNSSLFRWLMDIIIGESVGGNSGNADNVKNLSIFKPSKHIDRQFRELILKSDTDSIDRLIFQIYSLDEAEINFISASVKPKVD